MKLSKKIFLLIFVSLLFSSCDKMVPKLDADFATMQLPPNGQTSSKVQILFSHNINGEMKPCGCRHFPLGGFPSIAGALHLERQKAAVVYVDTGDTFFPSSTLAAYHLESLKHIATGIRDSFNQLNLNYFVPGDQDFAAGKDFFNQLMAGARFKLLASNLKKESGINSHLFDRLVLNNQVIYFVGILNPELYTSTWQAYITEPESALEKVFQQLKSEGFRPEASHHSLVVLSHGGMEFDQKIAKKFPQIDWIIGSHTQNFTSNSIDVNETRIVQVLSRNHYLGKIEIPFSPYPKGTDEFENLFSRIEIRQELEATLSPNPQSIFLQAHETDLKKIQEKEQMAMATHFPMDFANSYSSVHRCQNCHQEQTEFWQTTSHALAMLTLIQKNKQNDSSCIGCHSLGYGDAKGFLAQKNIITSQKKSLNDSDWKSYWTAFRKKVATTDLSVRQMPPEQRKKIAQSWLKLDEQKKIDRNFANVQCLNCHNQHLEHPYENQDQQMSPEKNREWTQKACLACHNYEQSPEWYRLPPGEHPKLDEQVIKDLIKKVSCPKIEKS